MSRRRTLSATRTYLEGLKNEQAAFPGISGNTRSRFLPKTNIAETTALGIRADEYVRTHVTGTILSSINRRAKIENRVRGACWTTRYY